MCACVCVCVFACVRARQSAGLFARFHRVLFPAFFSSLERSIQHDKEVMDDLNAQLSSARAEKIRMQAVLTSEEALLNQVQVCVCAFCVRVRACLCMYVYVYARVCACACTGTCVMFPCFIFSEWYSTDVPCELRR